MKNDSSPTTPQGAGAEHTPTPWWITEEGDTIYIMPPKGNDSPVIATLDLKGNGQGIRKNRANAAFIVTACNQHAALTARNKELVEALKKIQVGLSAKSEQMHREGGTLGALIDTVNEIAARALLSQPTK
jgi:hypothetical protein